jgi:nucleotide-binding universal stress UspA family protein
MQTVSSGCEEVDTLRSILVGLDGSVYSDAATMLGIRWSKRFGCRLTAVAVVAEAITSEMPSVGRSVDMVEKLLGDARRHAAQSLDQFAYRCGQAHVEFGRHQVMGAPYDQILNEAQQHDLLLLGQHTYFRYHAVLLEDATIKKVVKHAPRPIVAVPAELSDGAGVLIAYDGRVEAARAVQAFLATGLHAGSQVWLMNVNQSPEEADRLVGRAARFLELHDIKVTRHSVVSEKHTHTVILEEAKRLGVELIVMGAYGQPPLNEFLLGSVTTSVLKESRVPLFLYH